MASQFDGPRTVYSATFSTNSPHAIALRMLEKLEPPRRILDLGCASGYMADRVRELGHYVVGVDGDPDALKAARDHCDKVLLADLDDPNWLAPLQGKFDTVPYTRCSRAP